MKTRLVWAATVVAALSNLVGAAGAPNGLLPVQPRCEFVEDPLGVDVAQPRLFWKLESDARAQRQSAWQVLVASSAGLLDRDQGDLWDSGKVESDETIHIPYGGRPLRSSQEVFWKVRVWDRDGQVSSWSQRAAWTMGLLEEADWKGKWLSAEGAAGADKPNGWQTLLLRREFAVKPGLERAVLHVCGLGQYELEVNGQKAGDDLLSPGWTKYDKTCLYDTRDVTGLLRTGANAIGLVLGNGMYNVQGGRYVKFKGSFGAPKAIARLVLEYKDGASEALDTDERWHTASGPITFSCVYGGEDYDARLEPRGWDLPGFAEAGWAPAKVVRGPGGRLKGLSCAAPPIRPFEVVQPLSVKPLRPGAAVYDLGQNVSLMPRLTVRGPPGAVVKIIPAELVKPDGSVDRGSCGGGACYWQYTLAGGAAEKWFPKFFYHGCRYLQVECAPPPGGELPRLESLQGVVVHSSSPAVGEFECSNPLFNRIRTLVRWAQRSNMMSVMTDCPHREKLGWLEEDHLNGPSLRYEFDLARLFTKVMNDMADSQRENGLVPDIAPEYVVLKGGFLDSPEWGSAFILVPWQQYEFTGDVALLRAHYDAMKRYVAYLGSRAAGHIVSHGLGDWYDLGPNPPGVAQLTPLPLTATAFYYYDTWILSQAAGLLGKADDARQYADSAAAIRAAFNERFFNPATGQYATGSQCANAIPLVMGLAEAPRRQSVLEGIVRDVRARGNGLTAGDVGYRYLLRALAEGGRSDVIFDVNNQSEKPGYGCQLRQGATSLTEAWDAGRGSSQNHFMLGQIMEWFYHDLAGISCDPAGPGFKKIIIKPAMVGDVTWAKAAFKSIRGDILCSWTRNGSGWTLKTTLPANTTATVFVPAKSAKEVTESGVLAERSQGVRFIRQEPDSAVYEVASGHYDFRRGP
ncbi:MAG: family 78 glycoside hydrolase catalytic domain [Limisphaerales bacterium]